MGTRALVLLAVVCLAGCAIVRHPPLTDVAITRVDLAFQSDRPGLSHKDRTIAEPASTDMLLLKVTVSNPHPTLRKVAPLCRRDDWKDGAMRRELSVGPASDARLSVPFFASVVSYRVRCRVEQSASGAGPWVEVEIPANDNHLPAPG